MCEHWDLFQFHSCHFLKENKGNGKHDIGEHEVLAAWHLFHAVMESNYDAKYFLLCLGHILTKWRQKKILDGDGKAGLWWKGIWCIHCISMSGYRNPEFVCQEFNRKQQRKWQYSWSFCLIWSSKSVCRNVVNIIYVSKSLISVSNCQLCENGGDSISCSDDAVGLPSLTAVYVFMWSSCKASEGNQLCPTKTAMLNCDSSGLWADIYFHFK